MCWSVLLIVLDLVPYSVYMHDPGTRSRFSMFFLQAPDCPSKVFVKVKLSLRALRPIYRQIIAGLSSCKFSGKINYSVQLYS